MKRTVSILTLVCIIALVLVSQNVSASNEDYFISVRIKSNIKTRVNISSDNGFYLYKMDKLSEGIKISNENQLTVTLEDDGKILLRDTNNEVIHTFDKDNEFIASNDRLITVEGAKYRGYITFKETNNELAVINYVDLENYLYGVIPDEMPASWEIEALKAQSVAARTYAIKNINKHSKEGYNLCDTTHCQVYGGLSAEYDRSNKAVDETKGMVATYSNSPIDSVYSSNSGGYTANAQDVWGNYFPYLVAVEDPYSPEGAWEKTYSSDEISRYFNVGKVIDIEITDRTNPDGRVDNIKIIGTNGEEELSGNRFRSKLGFPSTMFTVESDDQGPGYEEDRNIYVITGNSSNVESIDLDNSYMIDGNGTISSTKEANSVITSDGIVGINKENSTNDGNTEITFKGKGNGHGVGMSQYGAQGMAKAGKSFEEILKHYYQEIAIETIY